MADFVRNAKLKKLMVGLLSLAIFSVALASPPKRCDNLLLIKHSHPTQNLLSYLSQLHEQKIIGEQELQVFLRALRQGILINPISEQQAIASTLFIHREAIEDYLKNAPLDLSKITQWTKNTLQETKRVQELRKEIQIETDDIFGAMIFHPIPGGKFLMGEPDKKIEVELTHEIEVMDAPVTQAQWFKRMGKNPAYFTDGEDKVQIQAGSKTVTLLPQNPIESVNWWSVLEFANRVSMAHGLKPVYDLSNAIRVSGSAELGNLMIEQKSQDLIKINAPDQDIYRAEGYRLPTEAEQEYLLRSLGQSNGEFALGEDYQIGQLLQHAWFNLNHDSKNPLRGTKPIRTKKPILILGNAFFDLHGNINELSHDSFSPLRGGKNPQNFKNGSYSRIARGGHWRASADGLKSSHRQMLPADRQDIEVGFRLVRTLDPEKP